MFRHLQGFKIIDSHIPPAFRKGVIYITPLRGCLLHCYKQPFEGQPLFYRFRSSISVYYLFGKAL